VNHADLIALNRSEHMYWAGEGYLGAINQPYILRLDQAVDEALVRQTLRELLSAYPRMRAVIEPSALSYHLRVLPDDHHLDQLFADAYRVQAGVDPSSRQALQTFHCQFLNEAISLERGLPWRARFLPHPQQPALMFSVHHIIGDGRSMVQMLCAIMGRLNGQAIAPCKLDSPSMIPAVTPLHWWQWPGSIARWWRQSRADAQQAKGQRIITLVQGRSQRYTTAAVRYHELPCPADVGKQLAKQHGTTVNTLMTAVIANTFLSLAPDEPQAVAAMRISVDLRRYFPEGQAPDFGNFVSSFTVRARRQPDLASQIADIEAQVKANLARYERRDFALPLMFYELLPLIGRTLYSHLIVRSKAQGTLPQLSCHLSNLGSAEFINPKGARIRLQEMWPATISTVFLMGLLSLNGKQLLTVIQHHDEIPDKAVSDFLARLDAQLQQLTGALPQP